MSQRFSRIRQAAYLNQAVDNYIQWLQSAATRPRNIGGGTNRPPSVEVSITPFGFDAGDGIAIRGTATQAARTQMSSAIGARGNTVASGIVLTRMPGFKAARASLFISTGSSTVATSQITGLRYLKSGGTSYSHPFGKAASTDFEYESFSVIRTALLGGGANRRVSYQAELRKQV